jgi:hypothetical protein
MDVVLDDNHLLRELRPENWMERAITAFCGVRSTRFGIAFGQTCSLVAAKAT